jgi:hypothetical protein
MQGDGCWAAGKEERRYPILYWSRNYSHDEVSFNIPEGYEIYHLPERVDLKNPYFEYHLSYQRQGEHVLYQDEFIKNGLQIHAKEYTDYRDLCYMMERSRERYVVFRKNEY